MVSKHRRYNPLNKAFRFDRVLLSSCDPMSFGEIKGVQLIRTIVTQQVLANVILARGIANVLTEYR